MNLVKCTIPKEFCNVRDKEGFCVLKTQCQPIIDKCEGSDGKEGCNKIENGYCRAYINPQVKWKDGRTCPAASHVVELVKEAKKVRVGQQKQKKPRR